jgi:hypothetical protein
MVIVATPAFDKIEECTGCMFHDCFGLACNKDWMFPELKCKSKTTGKNYIWVKGAKP